MKFDAKDNLQSNPISNCFAHLCGTIKMTMKAKSMENDWVNSYERLYHFVIHKNSKYVNICYKDK